ncbi:MAG: methionyl-tRNA formyltransferase [Bacteriovoracaceae bacterium]|nr:methionyl-tRNA formyltransferase [Bacteriovoracaceae bacterium]
MKHKVVFFGTPEFCLPVLQILKNHPLIELSLVVSMPDRPAGRGQQLKSPAVIEFCKEYKLDFAQSEKVNQDSELLARLKILNADFFVVLAFAQFLSKEVLGIPKSGCFNIHTSLLPRWRGAAPIQHALLAGDIETGVSIQRMVSKMDAGDVAIEKKIGIRDYDNQLSLTTKLHFACAEALEEFIDQWANKKLNFKSQDESAVTLAPEISKEAGKINFKEQSAAEIDRRFKAFAMWPGLFSFSGGKRIKLTSVSIMKLTCEASHAAGDVFEFQGQLMVACKEGHLRLARLQWEGKTPIHDYEYLRSHKASDLIFQN